MGNERENIYYCKERVINAIMILIVLKARRHMNIKICSTNQFLYSSLKEKLEENGYDFFLEKENQGNPHLWLVDTPELNNRKPCLVILDTSSKKDMVAAFNNGAEDCCIAPLCIEEIIIRINKILFKLYPNSNQLYFIDGYYFDLHKKIAYEGDSLVELTAYEFTVVSYFIEKQNIALRREEIVEAVWGKDYYGSERVVDDTIRRIRKKLPNLRIKMIYGYGYRLD